MDNRSTLQVRTDLGRVRRLFRVLVRLAREAWAALGLKLAGCIATRVAATGAQLASILLFTAYLDRLLDDAPLGLPMLEDIPARADWVIYVASAIIVGLFALSGALTYLYGRWSWRLAGRFEVHMIRRIFSTLTTAPPWYREAGGVPITSAIVGRATGSDCRRTQFAFRHLLQATVEPFAIVVSLAALIWISPKLSALVVPVALAALPFVMRVNRRAATMTRELEETAKAAAPERRLLLHRLRTRLLDVPGDPWLERFLSAGNMAQNIRAFGSRRIVIEESKAVLTFAFSGLLLLVVGVGGRMALDGATTWGALVAFLLLMRLMLGQAVSFGATMTLLSRLYPILSRLFALLDGAASATREAEAEAPVSDAVVTLKVRSIDGVATTTELRPSMSLGILTPLGADGEVTRALSAAVERGKRDAAAALFARIVVVSGASQGLRKYASGILPNLDARRTREVVDALADAGLPEVAAVVRDARAGDSEKLPRFFPQAVLLAAAGLADAQTVVVDAEAIRKIPDEPRQRLLARLAPRLLLFIYPVQVSHARLFTFNERSLLVHAPESCGGWHALRDCDWPGAASKLQAVVDRILGDASAEAPKADDDLDDEDLDG